MNTPALKAPTTASTLSGLGLLGAFAASSCCLLPLGLVAIGVGGAWMPSLTALAPYQGLFLFISAAALCTGFGAAYAKPDHTAQICAEDICAPDKGPRFTRITLWLGLLIWLSAVLVNFLPLTA